MNIETFIYLVDISENINCILNLSCIIWFICLAKIIWKVIGTALECNMSVYKSLKCTKIFQNLIVLILVQLLLCLIPSQKTMYLMMGSHYLKQSAIPNKVEKVLNKKLDEYLLDKKEQE